MSLDRLSFKLLPLKVLGSDHEHEIFDLLKF
jgi:hypothetical protein